MKVAIRYFTGTGNTARAATLMEGVFRNASWTVDRRELRSRMVDPYGGIEDAELLVVAFPALGFSPPIVVRKWIKHLPKASKSGKSVGGERLAATLCVGGAVFVKDRYIPGWSAGAPFSASRAIEHRGWKIAGIGEVSYPENWTQVSNPPNEKDAAAIRAKNDPDTRAFAASLAKGENPWLQRTKTGRFSMVGIAALFRLVGRRMLGRLFVADASCTGCGLCARACPAVAIRMKRGRPRWNLRCVACNRCINICPVKSIRTSSLALGLQLAFAIGSAVVALSAPLSPDIPIPARGAIRAALIIALTIFQLGPFSWLLAILSRMKRLRAAFSSSFMADFRRYIAPDFRPSESEGNVARRA